MLLHPAPKKEAILDALAIQATLAYGAPRAAELRTQLEGIADAMAAIAAHPLPGAIEPFFP